MTIHSSYLHLVLTPKGLYAAARRIRTLAKKHRMQFDAVVFTGYSGALVGPLVAAQMGKDPIFVRKEKESNHSSWTVEGSIDVRRYVIVDDFVSSGRTIERVLAQMREHRHGAECVGILQYNTSAASKRWDHGFRNFLTGQRIPVYRPDRRLKVNEVDEG